MCENPQAIYDMADILKDVLPFALKLFPIIFCIFSVFSVIRFIKSSCQCRRVSVSSKSIEYPKYKFDDPDCATWVHEFEEKEDISIYG